MTISHMAMNVGHQVFLNNCWGLKCTIGRTNFSSLNTASQQLHSGVKVIQRSGCKQNDRVEKYLWSVPLGKRLRFWPKHPLLTIKYSHCSAHIVWPLPCLWAVKKTSVEPWVYMLLESWSQATMGTKPEEFLLSCHCISYSCSTGDYITSWLISNELWKLVGDFLYCVTRSRGNL